MTDPSTACTEFIEKSADVDFLREMLQFVSQRMMDLDVEGRCGAAYGERDDARENSKADFHVHLLQGAHSAKRSFPNTSTGYAQLDRWLKNRKSTALHACMEATGAYWLGLATHLHASEVAVSLVNPARIKSFARSQLRRTKTDVVDAKIIADFCRTQALGRWEPPLREHQEIRALLTYRDHLVAEPSGFASNSCWPPCTRLTFSN